MGSTGTGPSGEADHADHDSQVDHLERLMEGWNGMSKMMNTMMSNNKRKADGMDPSPEEIPHVSWSINAIGSFGSERYAKKITEVKINKSILTAR